MRKEIDNQYVNGNAKYVMRSRNMSGGADLGRTGFVRKASIDIKFSVS